MLFRSRNVQRRQAAERTAINAPMQGTAADIIKKAMLSVYEWIKAEGCGVKMAMQVHDELVFEVPEADITGVRQAICQCMEGAVALSVPLKVDAGVGRNWDEAH